MTVTYFYGPFLYVKTCPSLANRHITSIFLLSFYHFVADAVTNSTCWLILSSLACCKAIKMFPKSASSLSVRPCVRLGPDVGVCLWRGQEMTQLMWNKRIKTDAAPKENKMTQLLGLRQKRRLQSEAGDEDEDLMIGNQFSDMATNSRTDNRTKQ